MDSSKEPQLGKPESVVPSTPEQALGQEIGQEDQGAATETAPQGEEAPANAPAPAVVSGTVQAHPRADRLADEIDDILEEDLKELYLAMSVDQQRKFRAKGEETVSKIRELVRATKINAKKIFRLIREWLKLIPGVNRFFLEQEAKIKTDKILAVSEEERARSQNKTL